MSVEEPDYQIQRPEIVAKRALALAACCCRGFIDEGKGNPDAESVRERMIQWIEKFKLKEQLGPFEWDSIRSPLGGLESVVAKRMSWEAEGLAVLAWALQLGQLPMHDDQVDPYAVTDSVFFLGDEAGNVVANASLRESEQLLAYREMMYAIHCRIRYFFRNGEKKDFTSWIEPEWLTVLKVDSRRLVVDGDLGFEGKPMSAVEPGRLRTFEWGINAQHRASVWLIGEEEKHWETPADT